MFLQRNTFLLVGLLCCLSLWCKSTSAGSSFLSPAQKPQNRGKSPRAGRQVLEDLPREEEEDESLITVTAPFEIGVTMTTEDFEEYGVMLQELVHRLLGDAETPEKP